MDKFCTVCGLPANGPYCARCGKGTTVEKKVKKIARWRQFFEEKPEWTRGWRSVLVTLGMLGPFIIISLVWFGFPPFYVHDAGWTERIFYFFFLAPLTFFPGVLAIGGLVASGYASRRAVVSMFFLLAAVTYLWL